MTDEEKLSACLKFIETIAQFGAGYGAGSDWEAGYMSGKESVADDARDFLEKVG